MAKQGRPGASKGKGKKGPQVGTGGHGRKALEGRGPTPKAEDRSWHVAGKRKAAKDRLDAARSRHGGGGDEKRRAPRAKRSDDSELVTGRNSVVEALRYKIPATTLYLAARLEMDDRVKESLALATKRGIPILEVMRPELDRMTGPDSVHQGIVLKVPPYEYPHPMDLLDVAADAGAAPIIVALDGITDPRNLGAIVRSVAAFGGHGVVVPQRRSVGMTASAWKTSAGAASRVKVAMAANLARAIEEYKKAGLFVVGLDGGGEVSLPRLELATEPIVLVVGSEGEGLSRLIAEKCDAIASIPIGADTESLNASVAAGVALYEVARRRGA